MVNFTGTYTDQYQLTMAQVYFLKGRAKDKAVFDYFFRKLPFEGGYAIFAGLDSLVSILADLRFDEKDIDFLRLQGFHKDFVNHLKNFRFTGNINACREGEVVFPLAPVLRVEASIIEAQIIETLLLNMLNFQSLIATKATRVRQVAGARKIIEFGLRRAQGPAGYYASRAAMIGGFDATSNVRAGRDLGIPVSGTMAHSFIQSYGDELTAFRDFAEVNPDQTNLLVDTYDTLNSGIPNAIKVGKEMEASGHRLRSIRLDSGDLAYLAKKARKMLDDAGLTYVEIAASNQLDERVIKSLLEQKAPIDVFGVGTSLVIGRPDAALDGVYKLAYYEDQPRIKLSENIDKINFPGTKQVYRLHNEEGRFIGADVVALKAEKAPEKMFHPSDILKSMPLKGLEKESLLTPVIENGRRTREEQPLKNIAEFVKERLALLPEEFKRFDFPHIYKVGLSEQLRDLRQELIRSNRS